MRYPFCDGKSTVRDVLVWEGSAAAPPRPLQRKMARKVFEEFKIGKSKMRLEDVDEALQVQSKI